MLRNKRGDKEKQDVQEKAEKVNFFVNGKSIARVKSFRYLGRVLREDDNDDHCIDEQL